MIKSNIDSICFVSKITEINPIEGADKIEQVKCGDYSCISLKGANTIGELVILATTDAVIPIDLSEKLNITNYLRKGNRVKTIKLKKNWSECLIIKPKQVPDISDTLVEGEDMEKSLGIFKYEEPDIEIVQKIPRAYFRWNKIHKIGMWRSYYNYQKNQLVRYLTKIHNNPNFKIYFKFPNIKNAPNVFEPNELITIQRKIHGSNARYLMNSKGEFYIGSHRVVKDAKIKQNPIKQFLHKLFIKEGGYYKTNIWQEMSDKYQIESKLLSFLNNHNNQPGKLLPTSWKEAFINDIEIYGEVYGEGVQGIYDYSIKGRELALFDIQINGKYLSPHEVTGLLMDLELPMVTVYSVGTTYKDFLYEKDRILSMKIPNSNLPEEGVVIKSLIQGEGNLKAVKCVSPNYLEYAAKNEISDFH